MRSRAFLLLPVLLALAPNSWSSYAIYVGKNLTADGSADWSLRLHTAVEVSTVEILVNGEVVDTRDLEAGRHHALEGRARLDGRPRLDPGDRIPQA